MLDQHTTDMIMPEIDGLRLLEILRDHDQFSVPPVLVMSTLEQSEARDETPASGALDALQKPAQAHVLIDTIHSTLKTHA